MKLIELNEATGKDVAKKGLGLSLSKIKTFDMCNYKYYLQYVAKEAFDKEDFNPEFFKRGQFAHKWIESKITGTVCTFDSKTLSDEKKQKTMGDCARVFDNPYIKNLLANNPEVEKSFSLYINPTEVDGLEAHKDFIRDADFHGYIDLYAKIGSTIHVVDWKTGAKRGNDDDTFMQLMLYAKACQKLHGGSKYELSFYYVDMKSKNLVTREFSLSELDEKIKAIVEKGVNIPKQNDPSAFPASPGWGCKYCPYSQVRSSDNKVVCEFTNSAQK